MDRRYNTIKLLIEGGHITRFDQIFDHIPKSVVANDLGTNYNRLTRLIGHVEQFTLQELFMLGNFFDVDGKAMLDLAYNQYYTEKKNKRK